MPEHWLITCDLYESARLMPARPGRVANAWLPYIRPHLRPYEALGRGDRGDYIAKLSKKVKLSDNTLRRFIAAAQFLEAEGITELRPDTRMPVAAVERIARIAARQPERRTQLLKDVAEGRLTIVQLRGLLKRSTKAAARRQSASFSANWLEDRVKRGLEVQRVCKRREMLVRPADDEEYGWLFSTQMRPSFVVHLPEARRVLVLDERMSQGVGASFMAQRREFLRHILVGASLYDFVFVFAVAWRNDVKKLLRQVQPMLRSQIILANHEG
jgi:hypothetical protein